MVLDAAPWALAVVVIAAAGARLSSRWPGAARLGLVAAVAVGLVGVESPPWPPVSASQYLPYLAPIALLMLGRGRQAVPAALGTGLVAALTGAFLLRRVFARDPLDGLLWCGALFLAAGLGSLGPAEGRKGLGWIVLIAGSAAAAIGATGSAFLSLDAGVVALATTGLLMHRPLSADLARAALGCLAVVVLLAMRLSSLPAWAGLGLLAAAGLPGLLRRMRR